MLLRGAILICRRVLRADGGVPAFLQTMLAQIAIMGVNLATGILTARLLGATGRGELAAANLWLLLPALLATTGFPSSLVFHTQRDLPAARALAMATVLICLLLLVPLSVACFVGIPVLMPEYSAATIVLSRLALLGGIVNVLNIVARQVLLATRDYRNYNITASTNAILYLLLLVSFACAGSLSPASAIAAQVAATALAFAVGARSAFIALRGQILWSSSAFSRLFSYAIRSAPIDIVVVLYGNIDRLVLVGLVTPAQLGLYTAATALARLIGILQTALSGVMLADMTSRTVEQVELLLHRSFRLLSASLMIASVIAFTCDHALITAVYGPNFAGAVPSFRVLLVEASLSCMAQLLLQTYLARGSPGVPSTIQVASFVVTLGGIALLAPMYGPVGAAAALAVGSAMRFALLLGMLGRIGISIPRPFPELDDFRFILSRLRGP